MRDAAKKKALRWIAGPVVSPGFRHYQPGKGIIIKRSEFKGVGDFEGEAVLDLPGDHHKVVVDGGRDLFGVI